MYCRKCGCELEPDAKFCIRCGVKVNSASLDVNTEQDPQLPNQVVERKKWKGVRIVVTIMAALIILGAGYVLLREPIKDWSDERHYTEYLQDANDAIERRDYKSAAIILSGAISVKPDVTENYLLLAQAYVEMWDLYHANEILQKGYEWTGDASLQNVSIWGPMSPVETAICLLDGDPLPLTRCEYYFGDGAISSFVYIFGLPIAGSEYLCEDGFVRYVTLMDYDGYECVGIPVKSLPVDLPALREPLIWFDLEYNFSLQAYAVTWDGKRIAEMEYEDGKCVSITASCDHEVNNLSITSGEKIQFGYDDTGRISEISYGEISWHFEYLPDGGYEAYTDGDPDSVFIFDQCGMWVGFTEGGGNDDFSMELENGKITSVEGNGLREEYKYDGNLLSELIIEKEHADDISMRTVVNYYYNEQAETERMGNIKISTTYNIQGEISDNNYAVNISYDRNGRVTDIYSTYTQELQSFTYSNDGRVSDYTVEDEDGVYQYSVQYDEVGRELGILAIP